jgi:DNA-binding CsgD family transcriptional regulator
MPADDHGRAAVSPSALLIALALGQAQEAAAGPLPSPPSHLEEEGGLNEDAEKVGRVLDGRTGAEKLRHGVALASLAARFAPPRSAFQPSAFLMDPELLVRGARGESVMRLPWFEEDLFVGRSVPEIAEMPKHVRALCVENYNAGLAGESRRFAFSSYGHSYTVDSVPVCDDGGRVEAVLAIANPAPRRTRRRKPDPLTARETEILQLAAHGMSGPEIAEHLVVSPGTVKTHFQNIYLKWNVPDRTSAVAKALREGLIE